MSSSFPPAIHLQPEFTPSFSSYAQAIRLDSMPEAEAEAEAVFREVSRQLKPKAMIQPAFITEKKPIGDQWEITIGEERFKGKALGVLKDVERVFLYIATCGNEAENLALPSEDMLAPYWVEELKLQSLNCARNACLETIRSRYHLNRLYSLNPGAGNMDIWPVEQLAGIFALMESSDATGVQLTPSSLMIPNKTTAGMFFTTQEGDYDSCAYCERANCPSRRVPFRSASPELFKNSK